MVGMYVAESFITGYGNDTLITELVDELEIFVIPVVNPDGYVYTWGPQRLWRKNRRDNGNGTFGVDLNRNWGYEWGGVGSSGDPGSGTYRGTAPFSEPETQVRRLLEHCGLGWSDACLQFHETKRPVLTASAVQVRSPLNSASIGRWRRFEKHLGPLIRALEA